MPRLSKDKSRLTYYATDERFLEHATQYQMKTIDWPPKPDSSGKYSKNVIGFVEEYPAEDAPHAGLHGYEMHICKSNYLGNSNRYYVLQSMIRGQYRVYIADLEKQDSLRWLNFLDKVPEHFREGEYQLLKAVGNFIFVSYSQNNQPPKLYCLVAEGIEEAKSSDEIKFTPVLLDEVTFDESIQKEINSIQTDVVRLENGAEGYLIRLGDDRLPNSFASGAPSGKHPIVTMAHGGPFTAFSRDLFNINYIYQVLQGYCLFIINYQGSTGYGRKFLHRLLGGYGTLEVDDCANLTKKAIADFGHIVDGDMACVQGLSYGGNMTAQLTSHPEYKDMWKSAVAWNPILDAHFNSLTSDIKDWAFATIMNRPMTSFKDYTKEDMILC
mmetsp:Transcript_37547/g.57518  ORF Transcript_37547/g.57518 Transcript_37547/m.57518 type:complete len:383 (+) Transcript_37547:985-2133(+)